MEWLEVFGYLGALITGLSLGLIGGGGSILIVPVLVYLFSVEPSLATAYSLFVVGAASLVGAFQYARQGLVEYKTALIFGTPAFIGVFAVRSYLIPKLPDQIMQWGSFSLTKDALIMLVFAVVMVMASFAMIRKKSGSGEDDADGIKEIKYNYKMIALEGIIVGAVTGFVGAGGGFLIIPALVILANLPMKLAVGTSLVIISAKSLLGFLGDVANQDMMAWGFLLLVTAIAVLGIFLGTFLSRYIPGKKLKPAFGWFVLVMGLYIIGRQVIA